MRIKHVVRNVGDVAVIDLSGQLSPGRTLEDRLLLHDLVTEQLRNGHKKVLINLSGVTFIDSSGLGDLIGAMRLIHSDGGQLHLCNPSQRVGDVLYRTHLDSIIRCYNDESTALQAFAGNGQGKISAA